MSMQAESTAYQTRENRFKMNIPRMKTYFLWRLTSMRQQLIVFALCSVFSIPLICVLINGSFLSGYKVDLRTALGVLCFFAFCGMVIIPFMNILKCFDYLWRKSLTDIRYSLPLSHKERFWTDFAAGIIPMIMFYVISVVLGFFILLINGTSSSIGDRLNYVLKTNPGTIFLMLLGGIVGVIFFYCLVVFSISLCGRLFESAVMPFIIGAIIPAVPFITLFLIYKNVYAVNIENLVIDIVMSVSPFAFLYGMTYYSFISWQVYKPSPVSRPEIIIPVLIITALFIFGAYFLTKRRKVEQTGRGVLNKIIYHSIITTTIFCITGMFSALLSTELQDKIWWEEAVANGVISESSYGYSSGNIVGYITAMIISTIIIFILYDIVLKRGIKKPLICLARYVATFAGSLLVSYALLNLNGFGIGSYVPSADDVESVRVESMRQFEDNNGYSNTYVDYNNYFENKAEFIFSKKENIDLILQAHESSVENNYFINRSTLVVEYKLKNGKKMEFNIRMDFEEIKNLERLYYNSEYRNVVVDFISGVAKKDIVTERQMFVFGLVGDFTDYTIDNVDYEKLFEAFKKDYVSETYDVKNTADTGVLGSIEFKFFTGVGSNMEYRNGAYYGYNGSPDYNVMYNYTFTITSHYKNLIAAMKEIGLEFPDIKKNLDKYDVNLWLVNSKEENGYEAKEILLNEVILNGNPDVLKLLSVLKVYNVGGFYSDEYYSIGFSEKESGSYHSYRVPEEYNEIAEKLFQQAVS